MSAAAGTSRTLVNGRPRRAIDDLMPVEGASSAPESPRTIALRRLRANRIAQVAAVVFVLIVVLSMSAGWFERSWAGRTYDQTNLSGKSQVGDERVEVLDLRGMPVVGPGLRTEYTMGADPMGRDVFMRVLRGGQVSLLIGFGSAALTVALALLFGTMAGYFKGKVDLVISRFFDVMLSFPSTVFAIALSTALATSGGFWFVERGSPMLQVLIIGTIGGPYFGRIVRSAALSLSEREFVEAARALGASHKRIMLTQILPHLSTTTITYFGLLVGANLLAEAGLSFLGVGVLPPTPSWGNIIADGRIFYSTAWWISFFPGLMIMLTVLSLNLVGEALEEAFDPKAIGGK